jgi:hypothetical protein
MTVKKVNIASSSCVFVIYLFCCAILKIIVQIIFSVYFFENELASYNLLILAFILCILRIKVNDFMFLCLGLEDDTQIEWQPPH